MVGHGGLKAFGSVIPAGTPMWPVGGITPDNMEGWVRAGATGFGIGGALFQPGVTPEEIARRAREFVRAWSDAAG
jgi:2-dehydro-3-deoxyphosphogalactonate aldolase